MSSLLEYAKSLMGSRHETFVSCQVFAKVLTRNDDAGRHGVLIPTDAYQFFPDFAIPDPSVNATLEFTATNSATAKQESVAYKYYERYPERRITRLPKVLNDLESPFRILVFLRVRDEGGNDTYYFDCGNSSAGGRFDELFLLIFGAELTPVPGNFIIRPIDSEAFAADASLRELLGKFDDIKSRGWVDSLRTGDTGIGYTFETLFGIKENNDQQADFNGIEIKCKGTKEGVRSANSKLNLFQAGPEWLIKGSMKDRIRVVGKLGNDGLFACYSQVTAKPNNLGLLLEIMRANEKIELIKNAEALGYWTFPQLAKRLAEKHSRAAFVKARVRNAKGRIQFSYEELVYCDRPSIERFVDLVAERNIVFEFTMSEKPGGSIRNHGYPWRLVSAEFLDQLFTFQVKLR